MFDAMLRYELASSVSDTSNPLQSSQFNEYPSDKAMRRLITNAMSSHFNEMHSLGRTCILVLTLDSLNIPCERAIGWYVSRIIFSSDIFAA
jgi:hypothetical protein